MTIINPIYHKYFTKLFDQVDHHKSTILLCMCLQYWKISTYKVKGDSNVWFTRSLDAMADEMSISKSSLSRYLNMLEEKGLIQRINKLGWDSQSQSVKKRLYIRVTDKLLSIVGHNQDESTTAAQPIKEAVASPTITVSSALAAHLLTTGIVPVEKDVSETVTTPFDMTNANQAVVLPIVFDNTENVKMELSIYKGSYSNTNTNSTVRQENIVSNYISNPKKPQSPETTNSTYVFPVEKDIDELLTPQLKNFIKGMLSNMQSQHGLKFSNPEQLFAEVVFSVLNKDDQMPGIEDPHHRVNIIAKLLREKRWLTPKGFYNHWDIGAAFKQSEADNEARYQQQKQQDMNKALRPLFTVNNMESNLSADNQQGRTTPLPYEDAKRNIEQQNALREIMIDITTEERYLNQIHQQHTQKPNLATQSVIDGTLVKLARLQKLKQQLEEKLVMKNAA